MKAYPVGTINKYGERKMDDGTWKYIPKSERTEQVVVKQQSTQHEKEKRKNLRPGVLALADINMDANTEFIRNLKHICIEVRLSENQVRYYEVEKDTGKDVKCLAEEVIKWMIKNRRILVHGNRDFFAVFYRSRKKYNSKYLELVDRMKK